MSALSALKENGYNKNNTSCFIRKINKMENISHMLFGMSNGDIICNEKNINKVLGMLYDFHYLKCDIGWSDKEDFIEFLEKVKGVLDPKLISKILSKNNSFSFEPKSYKYDSKVLIPYIKMIDNMYNTNLISKDNFKNIIVL